MVNEEDLELVLRWAANTPLPRVSDSITTQVPREVIEAARRCLSLD